jgi:hypothetical protein
LFINAISAVIAFPPFIYYLYDSLVEKDFGIMGLA